jgi:hypothetical protein
MLITQISLHTVYAVVNGVFETLSLTNVRIWNHLSGGASLDVRSKRGDTVLHVACKAGSKAVISELLTRGADPSITNDRGETARCVADSDVLEFLDVGLQLKVNYAHVYFSCLKAGARKFLYVEYVFAPSYFVERKKFTTRRPRPQRETSRRRRRAEYRRHS